MGDLVSAKSSFIGYLCSFILIATYWLQHYVIFHYLTRIDRVLST